MLRRSTICVSLALAATPAFADVSANPQSAPKGSYKLDPNHTSVRFCVRHMGISDYCGRFNTAGGKLEFNGSEPAKSSLTVEIEMASIDTPSDKLDDRLRLEFFEAAKFPKASFTSTSIEVTGNNEGQVTGDLTLHGITKPVTLKVTFNGGQVHAFANAYVVGFSATTVIKHADFSFPEMVWNTFFGDTITLSISSEFIAEKQQ
jgi:polyisoprenoid-binding protein YceI